MAKKAKKEKKSKGKIEPKEVKEAVEIREEAAEIAEAEELEKEEPGLPLPMAPVVRMIKAGSGGKMISSKVKIAMNKFLGEVAKAVSQEMGKTRYPMVEMDDFIRAAKPYSFAKEMELEKNRVVSELEAMRMQIDALIKEFQRKFAVEKPDEFKVFPAESENNTEK